MKLAAVTRVFPSWKNILLAVVAALALVHAYPDFDFWFLAYFALAPLMVAIEREKASLVRAFFTGWIFGIMFFFGTCWWLTFAPITYAQFPAWLTYLLMFLVAVGVGVFPAIFAAILAAVLRRFGAWGFLATPVVWISTEFLRFWLTGNNWNAIGYSQAFSPVRIPAAAVGGVYLVGFLVMLVGSAVVCEIYLLKQFGRQRSLWIKSLSAVILNAAVFAPVFMLIFEGRAVQNDKGEETARVVAVQPNVPMTSLDLSKWHVLRQHQVDAAEAAIRKLREQQTSSSEPVLVILPESPMNFMYEDDLEFHRFIDGFARRNDVSVLFNSAEPDKTNGKYFNSAVMVGQQGGEAAQYDKIFLLPFGEAVPPFLEGIVPGFVGNFSYGSEYDLLPLGDARAGVMICFESHFAQLSRRYVQDGADVIIEMTNDGYLGATPVLRQHLANAVFRAVETNRPVLRTTNVGITAYINERGDVLDAAMPYTEDTRVWPVSRSDGKQTFYVRYGDWFAWLSLLVTIGLFGYGIFRRKEQDI